MNNHIFYHIYLYTDINLIINNQLNRLINSGILNVSELHIVISGDIRNSPLSSENERLINILSKDIFYETKNYYELITLKRMYDYALINEGNYLYIHTKGSTRIGTSNYRNIENWRHIMEHFTIDKYSICIDELKTHDLVGCNYTPKGLINGTPAHYSGNFWWATSQFINKLPDPINYLNKNPIDRFDAEFWVGRVSHKALCLYPILGSNPNVHYRGGSFTDESIYFNNIIKTEYENVI